MRRIVGVDVLASIAPIGNYRRRAAKLSASSAALATIINVSASAPGDFNVVTSSSGVPAENWRRPHGRFAVGRLATRQMAERRRR